MDTFPSSKSDDNIITNVTTTNKNEITANNNSANVSLSNPELPPVGEFPQPAITRNFQSHNSDVPPSSYPTNTQIPAQSHSRDRSTITLTSPPEYNKSTVKIITTQPLPQTMQNPPNINNVSTTNKDIPNDASSQLKICKICQEPEESNSSTAQDEEFAAPENYNKGKLISPCKCKGSLQYVHISCLNKWRHSNVRHEASYRCEVCKYEYKFYRQRMAKIFSSRFTLHFLSLTLLFSIILLVSYLVKLALHHNDLSPGKDHKWQNITFLNIRVIELIIGVSIVSSLGLMFFVVVLCLRGFNHTRQSYCGSFGCCFLGCGASSGGSGDADVIVGLFFLLLAVVIGSVGAIIVTYLFVQKVLTISLEKVHDQILEVRKD